MTQKNRTAPSRPYRIHTWCCLLCAMMVLFLSACPEPKTESSSGNADDSKTARVTITFIMNEGTPSISKQTVNTRTTAKEPDAPTRNGFVFDGWYTDNTTFLKSFEFSTTITQDTILYAKWDLILSLAGIIDRGTIPQDLRPYDRLVQTILAPYASGAAIVARYVTVAGAGNKDGSAWKHAKAGTDLHTTLQGINNAQADKVYLLLIGSGEYTVGDTLAMKNHVAIVGGWDSNGDWARAADTHTILNGDDGRQVFKNSGLDHTALLYEVEITKGKSDSDGGGMFNWGSSPALTNVTFSGNTATDGGGGMHNVDSSPVLTNVIFSGNMAQYGGGMFNVKSSPMLMNVTFLGNTASDSDFGGGGMYSIASFPVLMNVTFSGNTATGSGGGMSNSSSSPVLMNVTFSGNTAQYGGGMFTQKSSPTIVNAMFWGNTATTRVGPQIYAFNGGTITFAYSVIDKGTTTNGIVLGAGGSRMSTAVVIAPHYTDPSLRALANNGGFVSTHAIAIGSSAANIGLYVRKKDKTFYYSEDGNDWYTGFDSSGSGLATPAPLPSDAIDLTATDATGTPRTSRPDAGAYEAR